MYKISIQFLTKRLGLMNAPSNVNPAGRGKGEVG